MKFAIGGVSSWYCHWCVTVVRVSSRRKRAAFIEKNWTYKVVYVTRISQPFTAQADGHGVPPAERMSFEVMRSGVRYRIALLMNVNFLGCTILNLSRTRLAQVRREVRGGSTENSMTSKPQCYPENIYVAPQNSSLQPSPGKESQEV